MKNLTPKKPAKHEREKLILFGLVELYLKSGKPIGSQTLQEKGFEALSSATIRNYFAKLEEEGLLKQQHSSGGRIPTSLGFKAYADAHIDQPILSEKDKRWVKEHLFKETREITAYLQHFVEALSEEARCAVFLSAPRFDQDFLLDIKLVSIDQNRVLCVLVTDFGMIHTEVLYTDKKLTTFLAKRLESYFNWRLTGIDKPKLEADEEALAEKFYNELMLRHIVSYTNFSSQDLFQGGFSRLLAYPDFSDAASLASGLSLFENKAQLRRLLDISLHKGQIGCWVGEDLEEFARDATSCSVLAVPYRINQTLCGSFGILGPNRLPYRELFGLLKASSEVISEALTRSMYKFKITFRQPKPADIEFKRGLSQAPHLLLENKIGELNE